jgi:hypothetical protein
MRIYEWLSKRASPLMILWSIQNENQLETMVNSLGISTTYPTFGVLHSYWVGWKEGIKKKLGVFLTCLTLYLENNGGLTTMLEKLPNNGNVKVVVPFHVSKKRSTKPWIGHKTNILQLIIFDDTKIIKNSFKDSSKA